MGKEIVSIKRKYFKSNNNYIEILEKRILDFIHENNKEAKFIVLNERTLDWLLIDIRNAYGIKIPEYKKDIKFRGVSLYISNDVEINDFLIG